MHCFPGEYDTVAAVDSTWPISYVSWYDAILYCNARSKFQFLDTVYSYSGINRTTAGDIFQLTDFKVDFRKNGYRLTTEAEWMYAARESGTKEYLWGNDEDVSAAKKYAWYLTDSEQPVGTLMPNRFGIYDMAGNVSEWINEAKSSFKEEMTVNDYVGYPLPDASEMMVKGGSYHHDMFYLRIPCRSDVYPVTAASRNRHTGFRCVIGKIPNPTFMTDDNRVISVKPVVMTVGTSVAATGSEHAKLVFVNTSDVNYRVLCYAEFPLSSHKPYEFTDCSTVYTPSISPDGRWVAWADHDEGSLGRGKVFVRRLVKNDSTIIKLPDEPAFVPRWYVEPSSSDTFLLYVTSAQLNDQTTWNLSETRMFRFSEGMFKDGPVTVETEGAFHGGRSVDGTYLATGYPLLKMENLKTNERKVLFYAPLNGKPGNDTSQVCNVSISPCASTGDQVLFLDFGSGKSPSTLVGSTYRTHEYLFRGDFSGSVLQWYHVPNGYYSWNHTEWSNNEQIAVATAETAGENHSAIYRENLEHFKSTLKSCTMQNVKVLLMTFPLSPEYRNTDAYGPLGPSRSTAGEILEDIKAIAEADSNLFFYDANASGDHDFKQDEFYDYGHLCMNGAAKLSVRVDSLLHRMID